MSFNLHEVLHSFFELDITKLHHYKNHAAKCIWWTDDNDEPKIQIKIKDNSAPVLRLYTINSDDSISVKVTYLPHKNKIMIHSINPNGNLCIENIDNITSDESLFQRSLIDDMGGIEFSDIDDLKKLYNYVVTFANTSLKEC